MGSTALAILGFVTIIAIIVLLLRNITVPSIAFIGVTTITALILILTGTFSLDDMGGFVSKGVSDVAGTATLFIFSVLFFGIMGDAGIFDVIVDKLMGKVGDSVVGVAILTCIIATIAHLDGSGAATFLIVVPAMMPIYKKMHMRPTTMLLITVTAMGVMNLMPWGGPTLRAASILNMDANKLWKEIMPMQAVGIVIAFVTAIIWGCIEKKRGAGINATGKALEVRYNDIEDSAGSEEEKRILARPRLFIFNVVLVLVTIFCLIKFTQFESYYIFMIACVIALTVNYPGARMAKKIIKAHAPAGLDMAATILGAGVFLGVLEESGIMENMANLMTSCIPSGMGRFLPLIVGITAVPLALCFSTDSYFYGLLPVLITIGNKFGVDPVATAVSMVVCRNCATFISPVVPATFMGTGLAGVEIKDHIRNTFFWVWGVSLICLISGILFGIIRF